MLRIYRMWRMVRLIERHFIGTVRKELHTENITNTRACAEFMLLRKITGRHYTSNDALRAYLMAKKDGYIGDTAIPGKRKPSEIMMSGSGFEFSSVYGLLSKAASSATPFGVVGSWLISVASLAVAIITLNHK